VQRLDDRNMTKNISRIALFASTAAVGIAAFETRAGWKVDDNGNIILKDGHPVYINAAGEEMTVQGDTISRLNGEAMTNRVRAEKAEKALEPFKDIDPESARKAIETIKKIDSKALIDAGDVDKVKESIKAEFTGQLTEKDKALSDAQSRINDMLVGGVFGQSDFIRDRVAIPRDMFEASMRSQFKVEENKVVAYDRAGNRLMSKKRVGEYAEPDEALELLVDMHPQKDSILKADDGKGSGNGGGGGGRGGGRVMRRGDFEKLPPMDQAAAAASMQKGELTIAD
jgi:hypothetical protein